VQNIDSVHRFGALYIQQLNMQRGPILPCLRLSLCHVVSASRLEELLGFCSTTGTTQSRRLFAHPFLSHLFNARGGSGLLVERHIHDVDDVPFPYMHTGCALPTPKLLTMMKALAGITAAGITMTSLDPDELEAKVDFDRMRANCQ
jgi:hypothetical protein